MWQNIIAIFVLVVCGAACVVYFRRQVRGKGKACAGCSGCKSGSCPHCSPAKAKKCPGGPHRGTPDA